MESRPFTRDQKNCEHATLSPKCALKLFLFLPREQIFLGAERKPFGDAFVSNRDATQKEFPMDREHVKGTADKVKGTIKDRRAR